MTKIYIEHERTNFLRAIIDAIKDLYVDSWLVIDPHGIRFQTLDASRVSLVTCFLPSTEFNVFRCEGSHRLGVALGDLAKVLKCGNASDQLRILYDGGGCLNLVFAGKTNAVFDLTLVSPDDSQVATPVNMKYLYTQDMLSTEFQRILKSLSQFSTSLVIKRGKETLKFSNTHEGNQRGTFHIPTSSPFKEAYSEMFSLKYLEHFAKCVGFSDNVTLKLYPGVPLCVSYAFSHGSSIEFYLAPKMLDD